MIILETDRLILREIEVEDIKAFSAYQARPEFSQYLTKLYTQEETLKQLEKAIYRNNLRPRVAWYLSIIEKESNTLIGDIVLDSIGHYSENMASIGYGLNPDYWGQGYATEALRAVTNFAHDTLKLHRVATGTDARNIGSKKVLEKCGYLPEGVMNYAVKVIDGWSAQSLQYASIRLDLLKP